MALEYKIAQRAAETADPTPTKPCTKCREVLPLDSFLMHKTGYRAGRYASQCKECIAKAKRQTYWAGRPADEARKPVPEGHKHCPGCDQTLQLEAFAVRASGPRKGKPRPRCHSCEREAARAAYKPTPRQPRPKRAPTPEEVAERLEVERFRVEAAERRAVAREEKQKAADARRAAAQLRAIAKAAQREEALKRCAKRQRRVAERLDRLAAVLHGTDRSQPIDTEEDWELTQSEVRRLWPLSGDKTCLSCAAVVPHHAMLPPLPGNPYPGQCQSCARKDYVVNRQRVGCPIPDGPPAIHLRDGKTVTIIELARSHRERNSRYRIPRWAERPNLTIM